MGARGLSVVVVLSAWAALADDGLDVKAAMPALLKVLTYDENFDARGAGDFVVLVASDKAQLLQRDALLAALKKSGADKVKARAVRYVAGEFHDEGSLQAEIDRAKPTAVLLCPGLPAPTVRAASEILQDNQLYGLALEPAMVELSIPVGVSLAGGKPQIVINDKAARAVGAKFESSVLKLARVVQ